MPELDRLLSENLAFAFLVLVLITASLGVVVLLQSVRLRRALSAYRGLVGDGRRGTLEDVLRGNVAQVARVGGRLDDLASVHDALERRSRRSLQHIGLVRFNPFEDTGSDQSFVIALLDDQRDGVVISSLHGRASTRLFAKPVAKGASSHALSTEEAQAISIAVEGIAPASPA